MNTTATTASPVSQHQQLINSGFLDTWQGKRWLAVISAVNIFLKAPKAPEDELDKLFKESGSGYENINLAAAIREACDTDTTWEGVANEPGQWEDLIETTLDFWALEVADRVAIYGIEALAQQLMYESEVYSGKIQLEAKAA